MKKRLNIRPIQLVALLVVLWTSFSCSDKTFDQQAGERITPDQHYKSIIDAITSMGGAFAPLQNAMPKLIMVDGLRSDQMTTRPNADPFLKDINNQILSFDNPFLDASDYYKVIVNVNETLLNIDKIALTDRNFDPFIMKYTKGALVGLRSWTYLTLINLYGQAALIDDNLASLPTGLNQNILPKEVMIDTLIQQLLPYIPSNDELAQKVELRFTNFMNNKAILGQLYLEKGDYANAVVYLKLAIESYSNVATVYKVDGYTNEGWKSMFLGGESLTGDISYGAAPSENISVMAYDQNEGQFNPLPKWLLPTDQFMVAPTQLLVDSFKTQIPAQGAPGDIYRGLGTAASPGATLDTTSTGVYYINKYSVNKGEPFSSDITISRASDLHLMLAEALNRSGDTKTALVLLNAGFKSEKPIPAAYNKWNRNLGIRGRVTLKPKLVPDSIYVAPDTIKKVALTGEARVEFVEDLIMDERALELAFEGKRWFDLVRVANRRQNPAYLADKVAAKFSDPNEKEAVRQRLMNQSNWYLPFKK
ncbi:MAG TPA: hypothetical protein DCL77_09370 [Prolixibacteraceae bacterium]|jgi:tetratricopeptide (TPR) repeat protein|nr:hypothetical protein [Prolixibacteraceae bacterium]